MNNKNRNRGFALIELVIGIAVAAIVSGMVVSIVQFSSNSFRSTTSEEVTQRQAQAVTSQLNDFVINTKDAVCYYVENVMVSNDQNYEDITAGSTTDLERVTTKEIRLYEKVGGVVQEQTIVWNKANQTLLLDEDTSDLKPAVVLATKVADFSADLKDAFTHRKVYVTVKVVNENKSYGVDVKTINLRNNLLINQVPLSDTTGVFKKEIFGTKVTVSSSTVLPSESVLVHGVIQANYSVNQACQYYILQGGNTKVSQIAGFCTIDKDSGELKAKSYIKNNLEITVIAIPTAVMTNEYTESQQLALSATEQVMIVSKPIDKTVLTGAAYIERGKTEHYSAIVSGYTGVSNECIYTIKYNGGRVTMLDNGAVTIDNNGDVKCSNSLSQDFTVEIFATPTEVYNSELTDGEKDALSGKVAVQIIKNGNLEFDQKKDTMYTGQESIFSIVETHGLVISGISWSIFSGEAVVNSATGKVTINKNATENSTIIVKAEANYNGTRIWKTTPIVVKKPYFEVTIKNENDEAKSVAANFSSNGKYTPQKKAYSFTIQLNNNLGNISIINTRLTTQFKDTNSGDYVNFFGLGEKNNSMDSMTIETTNLKIPFSTYDRDKTSRSNTCILEISIEIELTDGTTGQVKKELTYIKNR